jgi:CubicO group peptidase (beta-lactamase class C family)
MKKKILGGFLALMLLIALLLNFTNKNYYYKTLWYNLPGIFDEDIFYSREIHKSTEVQLWNNSAAYNHTQLSEELSDTLIKYQTTAVLFIQHDSIFIEHYWNGTTDTTRSNSFSVAKSFISALIGRAIKLGYIKSIDQPVADFLPEYKIGEKRNITIRHLLTMSSGLDWDEAYSSLWSQTTEAYYGADLQKQMLALKVKKKPGEYFEYKSCDTELLAMVLTKAAGMPVATFLEKELWQPLGSASDAAWSLDHKDGMEKAYCCIYATAKDFARLGSLYLHLGNCKGEQLIDTSFIKQSLTPSYLLNPVPVNDSLVNWYGFQWWLMPDYKGVSAFYMRGILGQYVIAIPQFDMVVVRLGHKRGVKINNHYSETYALIDEALKIQAHKK